MRVALPSTSPATPPVSPSPAASSSGFSEALRRAREAIGARLDQGSEMFRSLSALEQKLNAAPVWSPRDLLGFQIKAQQLGLTVELVSKVAESSLASVRKLQSGG